jgi:hypothetical protein
MAVTIALTHVILVRNIRISRVNQDYAPNLAVTLILYNYVIGADPSCPCCVGVIPRVIVFRLR